MILAFVGGDPVRAYLHILDAAFGDVGVLSDTLVAATPLILTGLACALAFRMRLWNIGAEGQFLLGAWGASAIVLAPILPAGTPAIVVIPVMMVAGAIAGGVWGFIPGVLKARLGVNEIITSLMLNYVALFWIQYWVFGPWSEGGFQQTEQFPREAWLPRLTDVATAVPAFSGLTVHLGFLFGLLAATLIWFLLNRTRAGYEIRLIGDSPRAARYAGIDIKRAIIVVFVISGALAGLAGMSEVGGVVHRLQDRISPGYGYTAIIIAYLAHFGPFRVVIASVLFGALTLAGREIQPSGVPAMIQGVILFSLIAGDTLVRYRIRIERRQPSTATPTHEPRLMDFQLVLAAGVGTGTVLLFAAIGEIFAERSGVLNLGVEGMMLIGAVAGFSTVVATGNPWIALVVAMVAGGVLSLLHGVFAIHLRAEQVVSGLALTFLGTGLARVLGEGLSGAGATSQLPRLTVPVLSEVPLLGPIFLTNQSVLVYVGYALVPLAWFWIEKTRPGLHLRAVGQNPSAADAQGIDVYRLRYAYVLVGGLLAGLAGATITLAIQPGWFSDQTVAGRGWIAVGLVIFAQWSPIRAAFGAFLFGAISRFILDVQGVDTILGFTNPFQAGRSATFFLEMLPYLLVIVVVVIGSREALRKRLGAPAALGIPYVRGQRGV